MNRKCDICGRDMPDTEIQRLVKIEGRGFVPICCDHNRNEVNVHIEKNGGNGLLWRHEDNIFKH